MRDAHLEDRTGDAKMSSHWVRTENVAWQEIDGEAVLVSTKARKTWVLNATASLIWKCCDGTMHLDVLARRIAKAGGREANRVKSEILEFCRVLEQKGLIRTAQISAGPNAELPAEMCFAGFSLPPLIRMETTTVGARGKSSPRGVTTPF
jgi:hypothetical protein